MGCHRRIFIALPVHCMMWTLKAATGVTLLHVSVLSAPLRQRYQLQASLHLSQPLFLLPPQAPGESTSCHVVFLHMKFFTHVWKFFCIYLSGSCPSSGWALVASLGCSGFYHCLNGIPGDYIACPPNTLFDDTIQGKHFKYETAISNILWEYR